MLAELAAAAAIVPQRGIRGVTLGLRRPAVVARLGRPTSIRHGRNELYRYTELRYRGLKITFAFNQGASQIESTSRTDRTRTGVGAGSTEVKLRSSVPSLRCRTESATRHCWLGEFLGGRIVTDFFLKDGRVSRVVVGRVFD
jgi:hypothetical protein